MFGTALKRLILTLAAFAGAAFGSQAGASTTFTFTGGSQSFLVPIGFDSIFVEAWGAQGYSAGSIAGGTGGFSSGYLAVSAGQTLYIYVGGQGTDANINGVPMGGGFNGGGDGVLWNDGSGLGGGGGGASDVRTSSSLNDRVLVAGGGGGATANGGTAGAGGGLTGQDATVSANYSGIYFGGTGGTQAAGGSVGGSFGFGGDGIPGQTGWVGGGGGGWYGGGASPAHFGGGGGSSYIGGVTNGVAVQGGQLGNGMVRFTLLASAVPEPSTWAMMLLGFGAMGVVTRRRRRAQSLLQVA